MRFDAGAIWFYVVALNLCLISPFATNSYIRLGKKFGDFTMTDLMTHDGLIDAFHGIHMGITAENIAREMDITRDEQDDYAFLTQQRAIRAVDRGAFEEEIVPIRLKDYKGREYVFDKDEFPNRNSSREKLASLSQPLSRMEAEQLQLVILLELMMERHFYCWHQKNIA